MKIIRVVLGSIILFLDAITRPKKMKRSEKDQTEVDQKTKKLVLYQFHACPFCVKVRRVIHKLNLNIELRDAKGNEEYKKELLEQGGKSKVPCLRIEEDGEFKWMYESKDINYYLNSCFQ